MKRTKQSKLSAVLLAVVMMFGTVPTAAFAADVGPDGLCAHHSEHTPECGYAQETLEAPCQHEHSVDCKYIEAQPEVPCDMGCEDTDGDGVTDHQEGCAYTAAVEGSSCTHTHDEACGYAPASEGSPCTFVCEECGRGEKINADPLRVEGECTGECSHEAKIGDVHYDFLADAVAAAENGDTIELLKDVCVKKLSDKDGDHNKGILKFNKAGTYTILGNGYRITSGYESSGIKGEGPILSAWNGAVVNLGDPSAPGKSRLTIDGQNIFMTNELVFVHEGSTINMYNGTTICNGSSWGNRGGVGVVVYGTFNMYGGSIENNVSELFGGAIALMKQGGNKADPNTSVLNIYGGTIANNKAGGYGGAIYNPYGLSIHIENCTFSGNKAKRGGAILSQSEAALEIDNCTFQSNSASYISNGKEYSDGGAIYSTVGPVKICNSKFDKNSVGRYGGALFANQVSSITIENSIFQENHAGQIGGAVTLNAAGAIKGSTFKGNTSDSAGGGLFTFAATNIESSLFTENKSAEGGGIYAQECDLTIDDKSAVFQNSAASAGDDVFVYNPKPCSVTLSTADAMRASGKMGSYKAAGWFEDGYSEDDTPGTRYDAQTHAVELEKLQYAGEPFTAALKVPVKEEYSITYVLNDGAFQEGYTPPAFYEPGDTVTLPEEDKISKNGNWFQGWFSNEEFTTGPITEIGAQETGDKVFYAKWEPVPTDWDGLTVEKKADKATAKPGEEVTYTITVTNKTGKDLTNVTVSDEMDGNLTFGSADNGGADNSGTVTWTIASLADGESTTLTLKAKVKDRVADKTVIKNTAIITDATGPDKENLPEGNKPSGSTDVTVDNKPGDNTGNPTKPGSASPKTGDTSQTGLWISLLAVSQLGLGAVLLIWKKKIYRGRSKK